MRCLVAAWVVIALLVPCAQGQPQAVEGSATLQGTVRDSRDRPVAGATVYLRAKTGEQTLTAHTDSEGNYRFSALRDGTYTLRAEMSGSGEAAFGPFVLGQTEAKKVDLTIEAAFFDEPN